MCLHNVLINLLATEYTDASYTESYYPHQSASTAYTTSNADSANAQADATSTWSCPDACCILYRIY